MRLRPWRNRPTGMVPRESQENIHAAFSKNSTGLR